MVLASRWAKGRAAAAASQSLYSGAGAAVRNSGRAGTPATRPSVVTVPGESRHDQTVIARLQVDSVGLTVPVLDDDDESALQAGAGHIRGTAEPGGLGNFVIAGHRDTVFRPLRNIRPGMDMDVVTPAGVYHYIVDRTEIVNPDQVQVLDIGDRPEMTLITCFPFHYVGAAPQRFIVHAHLLSVAAGNS